MQVDLVCMLFRSSNVRLGATPSKTDSVVKIDHEVLAEHINAHLAKTSPKQ